jgi:hypothetical protein
MYLISFLYSNDLIIILLIYNIIVEYIFDIKIYLNYIEIIILQIITY